MGDSSKAAKDQGQVPALAVSVQDRQEEAHALGLYYRRLMLIGSAVFVALIGVTTWFGWRQTCEQEVDRAVYRVRERAAQLNGLLKSADDHVVQLARWAEEYPTHHPDGGAGEIRDAVKRAMAASKTGEFNLDALSALPPERRLGLLNALTSSTRPRANGGPSNLDLAISLLDRFKYGQSTLSFLRWSYFFSARKDLHAMSPWASSGEVLGAEPSIRGFLQESWSYEICKRSLPDQNPKRQRYWTRAYLDQAGAGMMVSLGAPVYWGDELVGVVGTDILLGFLSEFLWQFPDTDGLLLITNEFGQLLADRRGATTAAADVRSVDPLLPTSLRPWAKLDTQAFERGKLVDGNYVIVAPLEQSHWTLIYVLPASVVQARAMQHYAPQLVLSLLLLFSLLVMRAILWRLYVAPALAIANLVAGENKEGMPSRPRVPGPWQYWVDSVIRAFRERRHYLAALTEAKDALERKVMERTSELRAANAQLENLATVDPLTGAFNRRQMFSLLEHQIHRVKRGDGPFSILLLDTDHFRTINDTLGHQVGDAVLAKLVERFNAVVRATDSVCRYGGEEFLVLLPMTDEEGAVVMGERLRTALGAAPLMIAEQRITVTVSIGTATYQLGGSTVESLIRLADERLRAAKNAGGDRLQRPTA